MANNLWISEFSSPSLNFLAPQMPPNADQQVVVGVGSTQSAAFQNTTNFIRVVADFACSIAIGDNTVAATVENLWLPANVPTYLGVRPGQFLAAIPST